MEAPRLKTRKLTKYYPLMMTEEMKDKLVELKTFHNIDVPEWIREMIQIGIDEILKEKSIQGREQI